jgi:group II intron reverse transcriptase/maturase
VLQQSINLTLTRIYEPKFSDSSFGFRPGRSQKDAILRAQQLVEAGNHWVVDIDLEKFFDRINHDRLMHRLAQDVSDKRVLRLIGLTLRCGVLDEGGHEPTAEGSPQGSPLSPLLSNVVLDELDKELEHRGLSFCRYADDANIFVGSERAGKRVMQSITKFIEKRLKLKVNQTKSAVTKAKRVRFLGFSVVRGGIAISGKSIQRALEKLRSLIPRRSHHPLDRQVAKVDQWYRGWTEYYGITNFPAQFRYIEGHIRRRFRAQLVRNQKRRRHLYHRFVERGVPHSQARAAYDAKGTWQLANTRAATRAWSGAWFQSLGLRFIAEENRPHWRPLSHWKVL